MKLSQLTDKTLYNDTLSLIQQERDVLTKILWHLKEIERRRLFSDYKCGSLFEFCVKVLKYSEGQANRRIAAARLLGDLPELSRPIEKGELSLTQLSQAQIFFNNQEIKSSSEKIDILEKIKGKTSRESERIFLDLQDTSTPKAKPKKTHITQLAGNEVRVSLTIKQETLDKLKRLQHLKAHTHLDLSQVIDKMADDILKLWSPAEKNTKASKKTLKHSRYISNHMRKEIWKTGDGKCAQCGSTFALQIDHIKPFGVGGKNNLENLRLLCRSCNQRGRIKFYGDQNFTQRSF